MPQISCEEFTTEWGKWRKRWEDAAYAGARKGLNEFNENIALVMDFAHNISTKVTVYAENATKLIGKSLGLKRFR